VGQGCKKIRPTHNLLYTSYISHQHMRRADRKL
jgi:hypothetical protein